MPVLVDGNNLLFAARKVEGLSALIGRSMLCGTVGKWARRRKQRVHIVFDGPAPTPALAAQIGHPDLQVSFSGAGQTADAVLTHLLEADSAARRLLVVSSDRAIIRAARRRKARPVQSEKFWAMVQRDLARPARKGVEPKEKEAGLSPEAAEWWLDEFGLR